MIQQTVSIEINNHHYQIACPPQQKEHIRKLGCSLAEKVDEQKKKVGQVGNAMLLFLVALSMEDTLRERAEHPSHNKNNQTRKQEPSTPPPTLNFPSQDMDLILKAMETAITSLEKNLKMLDKVET